jgi:fumarate reductase flavoprotein subunit
MIRKYAMFGFILLLLLSLGAYAADTRPMVSSAAKVHQQNGIACAACHNTATPTAKAPSSSCVKCHSTSEGKYQGVGVKKYAFDGDTFKEFNPHRSHLVELPCTECHKTHVASVNYCSKCHLFKDMVVK